MPDQFIAPYRPRITASRLPRDEFARVKREPVRILHATIDGRSIAYSNKTEFYVQVGKDQGSYRTRYVFVGDLAKAVQYYRCINIGNGYKKRLLAPAIVPSSTLAVAYS